MRSNVDALCQQRLNTPALTLWLFVVFGRVRLLALQVILTNRLQNIIKSFGEAKAQQDAEGENA